MIVEKQVECKLARETEVLGENLPPQSGAGAGFLRALRFPLPIFISTNFSTITLTYYPGLVQ
jgi:hypothetical protein